MPSNKTDTLVKSYQKRPKLCLTVYLKNIWPPCNNRLTNRAQSEQKSEADSGSEALGIWGNLGDCSKPPRLKLQLALLKALMR